MGGVSVEPERALDVSDGAVAFAVALISFRALAVNLGVARVQPYGAVVVGDGAVVSVASQMEVGSVHEGFIRVGRESQGFVEVRERKVFLAYLTIQDASIDVRAGVFGVEAYRRFVVREGALDIGFLGIFVLRVGIRPVVVCHRGVGV